jgi:hypothetical protein
VPRVNIAALSALPCEHQSVKDAWLRAAQWLTNDAQYDAVPLRSADGLPVARMQDAWVQRLVDVGVARKIRRCDVRGHVKMFAVPEITKKRWRAIKFTENANEVLLKDTFDKVSLPLKSEITALPARGDYMASLDMVSWFDQMPLTREIGDRFCFRSASGIFALSVLPMGARWAVSVAQAATELLLDFPKRSRASHAYVDNIIFCGDRDDVAADVRTFAERVKLVGAVINEDVENVDELIVEACDWCGVSLCCKTRTVKLTQKVLDKLRVSWSLRRCWSAKGFATHCGLLMWSIGILSLPLPEFFNLFRFISDLGRRATADMTVWDAPCVVPQYAVESLERWTSLCFENQPREALVDRPYEWLMCCDASRWGFGYVAINAVTGERRTHGERWNRWMREKHRDKLGRSAFTEPHGIYNSLCHLIKPDRPTKVLIGTDSTIAEASFNRRWNTHSYDVNEVLRRLHNTFPPHCEFRCVHIPGARNYADPYSRNAVVCGELPDVEGLRRLLGAESMRVGAGR